MSQTVLVVALPTQMPTLQQRAESLRVYARSQGIADPKLRWETTNQEGLIGTRELTGAVLILASPNCCVPTEPPTPEGPRVTSLPDYCVGHNIAFDSSYVNAILK
jgi:hypothetical protein